MARCFLATAAARTLAVAEVARMTERQAFARFRRARWRDGEPACLHCGAIGAWALKREGWPPGARLKCKQKECRREFTVTSGTILAHHKLSFRTMLLAIAEAVISVKGKYVADSRRSRCPLAATVCDVTLHHLGPI